MRLPSIPTFFATIAAVGILLASATPASAAVRRDAPETIHGAIYVPSNAYNAPQMWKNFDLAETKRDFAYAKKIHIHAFRLWASYEYWQMGPKNIGTEFTQMLSVAHADGIRVLVSLFENDGIEPTPEHMWDTNPVAAMDPQSP